MYNAELSRGSPLSVVGKNNKKTIFLPTVLSPVTPHPYPRKHQFSRYLFSFRRVQQAGHPPVIRHYYLQNQKKQQWSPFLVLRIQMGGVTGSAEIN